MVVGSNPEIPLTLVLKIQINYLMGPYNADPNLTPAPYNAGPNLTPVPLTPALITPVSNRAEYKIVFIFAINGNIR